MYTGFTPYLEGVTGVTRVSRVRAHSANCPVSYTPPLILYYAQTLCVSCSTPFMYAVSALNSRENSEFWYVQRPDMVPPNVQILSRIQYHYTLCQYYSWSFPQSLRVSELRGWPPFGHAAEFRGARNGTKRAFVTLCTRTCYTLVTPVTPSKTGCTPFVYRPCYTRTPFISKNRVYNLMYPFFPYCAVDFFTAQVDRFYDGQKLL